MLLSEERKRELIKEAEENGMHVQAIDISKMSFKEGMDQIIGIANQVNEHMIIPSTITAEFVAIVPMSMLEDEYVAEVLEEFSK